MVCFKKIFIAFRAKINIFATIINHFIFITLENRQKNIQTARAK